MENIVKHSPTFQKIETGKSQIFDENHGLTSLEKCIFFEFFIKLIFLLSSSFLHMFILSKIKRWKIFNLPCLFCIKQKEEQFFQIFDENNGITPLKSAAFLTF